jgi:DNA-binding beta-propeller fold protein YncE
MKQCLELKENELMSKNRVCKRSFIILLVLIGMILFSGCKTEKDTSSSTAFKPELFITLPDYINTPDGMTLDPGTGNIILAAPNFNDPNAPGVIMKISPQNTLTKYIDMPLHAETGYGCPMGLDFGPDGNLYVADNQYFYDKDHKSRLMRVNVVNGQPIDVEVAVDGFKLSNAVIWKDDIVFVSDTFMDLPDTPAISAVYKFTRQELNQGTVHLKPLGTDPHLIARFVTTPNHREDVAGADGLTIDSKGNLYIASFGDGKIHKLAFDAQGKVAAQSVFVDMPKHMPCADGMFCDLNTDEIYVADSEQNAIHVVAPDGTVKTLWMNGDTNGADGGLDQPCESLIRGTELIIVNFDMPFPGLKNSAFDKPYTLSVIQLKK